MILKQYWHCYYIIVLGPMLLKLYDVKIMILKHRSNAILYFYIFLLFFYFFLIFFTFFPINYIGSGS